MWSCRSPSMLLLLSSMTSPASPTWKGEAWDWACLFVSSMRSLLGWANHRAEQPLYSEPSSKQPLDHRKQQQHGLHNHVDYRKNDRNGNIYLEQNKLKNISIHWIILIKVTSHFEVRDLWFTLSDFSKDFMVEYPIDSQSIRFHFT